MRLHRLVAGDQAFIRHIDGDLECRLGGALAGARLQHPQPAVLDGEFEVLHVAIMSLERAKMRGQLGEGLGHQLLERRRLRACRDARRLGDVLRRADAGDDILALRIDQKLAIELLLAGRGIAREGDAGRRGVAHIAEHHGLHADRGAPVLGDVVELAIGDGARRHPRLEHGADGAPQLLVHILRKGLAVVFLDAALVAAR